MWLFPPPCTPTQAEGLVRVEVHLRGCVRHGGRDPGPALKEEAAEQPLAVAVAARRASGGARGLPWAVRVAAVGRIPLEIRAAAPAWGGRGRYSRLGCRVDPLRPARSRPPLPARALLSAASPAGGAGPASQLWSQPADLCVGRLRGRGDGSRHTHQPRSFGSGGRHGRGAVWPPDRPG